MIISDNGSEDNLVVITVIVKKYHLLGIRKPSLGYSLHEWEILLRKLLTCKKDDAAFRNQIIWNIVHKIGRIKGSLKNRIVAF